MIADIPIHYYIYGRRETKRAIVMGASSGIGQAVAERLLRRGWQLGLAARRVEPLRQLADRYPGQVVYADVDVNSAAAPMALRELIRRNGGMDLYFHASGIGKQNPELNPAIELDTMETNAKGFTRMVGEAFRYFREQGGGHIACVTSIAGTKGLGPAPAYSATKALQNTYLQALEQLANSQSLNIRFTDLRPGFVDTPLLSGIHHYPLLLDVDSVADDIVRSVLRKRHVRVIDWRWRCVTTLWKLIPRWIWRKML